MTRLDEIDAQIAQGSTEFSDHVMGDPAVWWQLITTQQQLELAVELAAAYRWAWSLPDQPERDAWRSLLAATAASDVCDLPTEAHTIRQHITPLLAEDHTLRLCDCLLRVIELCNVPTDV